MTSQSKSVFKIVAVCLIVAWIGFLFAVNRAMHRSPEEFGRFMSKLPVPALMAIPFETLWSHARKGTLNIGDEAPDFTLATQDKSGYVRLSSFRGKKPVVLVFGSYT
jgi:hypothetical protein